MDNEETIEVAVSEDSTADPKSSTAVDDGAASTAYNHALDAQRQSAHRQALSELSAAKSAMADSQQRMKDSLEQGDWDRLTQEQSRMIGIASAQKDAELRAAQLEQPAEYRNPTEDFLSGRSEAARQWLRSHPAELQSMVRQQTGTASQDDTRRAARLQAAHLDAVGEGTAWIANSISTTSTAFSAAAAKETQCAGGPI